MTSSTEITGVAYMPSSTGIVLIFIICYEINVITIPICIQEHRGSELHSVVIS